MPVNINVSEVEEGDRDNFNVLTSPFIVFLYFFYLNILVNLKFEGYFFEKSP